MTEDAQYAAYRALVEGMAPGEVTVRTFDVSEGQIRPWLRDPAGETPASRLDASGGPLGLRAVRLSLAHRDVFKVQLQGAPAGRAGTAGSASSSRSCRASRNCARRRRPCARPRRNSPRAGNR